MAPDGATAPSVLHLLATDERRGAESFGVQLAEELGRRGWHCSVFAVRSTGRTGGNGVQALGRSWHDPRGLLAFRRQALAHDVVVAHGSTTLWTAVLGLPTRRPPFIYVNIGDPYFWSDTRARQVRVRALLSRSSHVAAISPGAAGALTDHLGVPPQRVTVLPNGRSTERFRPPTSERRAACRAALRLPPDAPVVAFVGALAPEKRPLAALVAVAALPDAHLVVAGDGPLRSSLEAWARANAPGRVHFLGSVERPEDVLAAADALVLTSTSEGVPGVLIEAGLTGLPCVTVDVGYTWDVVLDGRTGRVVDTVDSVVVAAALRQAIDCRQVWGPAAREHCAATFGLDKVVTGWEGLLTDVLASP